MYRAATCCGSSSKRAYDLFLQNLVKGTTHLSLGMEAIATGFGAGAAGRTTTPSPPIAGTPTRSRAGMDPGAAMAELLGRENGILGGKGGSMHLTDVSKGMMG